MATEARVVISGDASSLVTAAGRASRPSGASPRPWEDSRRSPPAPSLTALGVGAAAAASHLVSVTKGAVEAADALNKLSQRPGWASKSCPSCSTPPNSPTSRPELLQNPA